MGLSHSPKIVTDGLVLCLDAASKRSYPGTGTTWTDLAGGTKGTLTNGPTFSRDNGGGIAFDGTDDYVLLDKDITTGPASTITVWVRDIDKRNVIAGGGPYHDDGGTLLVITASGRSRRYLQMYPDNDPAGDDDYFVFQNDSIVTIASEWTHLSISRDALVAYVYVNGVGSLMAAYGGASMATKGSRTRSIGAYDDGAYNMDGRLACLQIYNRALTADEVRQNYNATRGRFQ